MLQPFESPQSDVLAWNRRLIYQSVSLNHLVDRLICVSHIAETFESEFSMKVVDDSTSMSTIWKTKVPKFIHSSTEIPMDLFVWFRRHENLFRGGLNFFSAIVIEKWAVSGRTIDPTRAFKPQLRLGVRLIFRLVNCCGICVYHNVQAQVKATSAKCKCCELNDGNGVEIHRIHEFKWTTHRRVKYLLAWRCEDRKRYS